MSLRKRRNKMLTYGEAYTLVNVSLELVRGVWKSSPLPCHALRMSREEADKYYTNKINVEFERLGYKRRSKPQSTYKEDEFDSINDYYDYHEAARIKIKLENIV